MTMGPAPMISTLWMSVRLGMAFLTMRALLPDHLHEAVEQVVHIMRTGARLRMALEAESRLVGAFEPLQAAVEQRNVRDPDVCWQRVCVHREAMVLAGDHHPPAVQVLHRMVGAVVAKLHLHRLCTARQSEQLVPEADAEGGNAGIQKLADGRDRIIAGLGIARTVG